MVRHLKLNVSGFSKISSTTTRSTPCFCPKIGDTSLDLPEATCLIQISSHLRLSSSRSPTTSAESCELSAVMTKASMLSSTPLYRRTTNEMYYSSKRQAFLVDQGYAFKVITHLQGIEDLPGLAFSSPAERRELLQNVMLQNE